jgi:hypothetical protein
MMTSVDTKRRKALTPGPFDGNATIEWLHPQAAKSGKKRHPQAATGADTRAIRWQRNGRMAAPASDGQRCQGHSLATQRSNGCTHKRQKAAKSDTHKRRQALTPGPFDGKQRNDRMTAQRRQALTPGPFDGNATIEWLHPQAATSADTRAIRWQRNDRMAAPTSGDKRSGHSMATQRSNGCTYKRQKAATPTSGDKR